MRVLLAGGAGYIGSHTAVALVEAGHDAVMLDELSNASATTADRIAQITGTSVPLVVGDAAADAAVVSAFGEHGPFDAIVHLRRSRPSGQSMQMPLQWYANNLRTTWALLRVGLARGSGRFLFSSTGTVYSDPAGTLGPRRVVEARHEAARQCGRRGTLRLRSR
ncbi:MULTISPECIES: NAD-dependent epimerase/dehydratase family protein [Microbacterium]|uniref:NAD-dependent epimerase/dehydratase family protein n=1 Tax=Microbacterium TaxID=33882 RepID=UPI00146EC9A4|nr:MULTISPECIES: NAD-dependent epimerase/dehydratase family protein [Microbacterium]